MLYLRTVPPTLRAAVAAGSAYVNGSLVKDAATHQVLSHLQPSRLLSEALSVGVAGPVGPAQLLSGIGQNIQLMQIQNMLNTLQTVASIGATASVLNLGVSIGGFALVLTALKKIDDKLGAVQAAVQTLDRKSDARFFAEMTIALRRAEGGFELPQADRRHRWLETEDRTDMIIEHVLERLKAVGVPLEAPRNAAPDSDRDVWILLAEPETIQLLGHLFNLVCARSEALLCLQRPTEAAQLSERSAAWLSLLPTDAKAVALARVGGRPLPTEQLTRVAREAKALTTWVARGRDVANERAQIFQVLHEIGVDTEDYVLRVRNHPEPELLLLPHGPNTFA